MGGKPSVHRNLSEIIAKQIIEVASSSKFQSSAGIKQSSIITVTDGSTAENIKIKQAAKINLNILKSSENNYDFITDLKASIKNKLNDERPNFPRIGPAEEFEITQKIDKSIDMNFSVERMEALSTLIEQESVVVVSNNSTLKKFNLLQKANTFTKYSNEVAETLSTEIVGDVDLDAESTVKRKPVLEGIIKSVFGGFNDLISLNPTTVIIIIMFITLVGFIGYKNRDKIAAMYNKTYGKAINTVMK